MLISVSSSKNHIGWKRFNRGIPPNLLKKLFLQMLFAIIDHKMWVSNFMTSPNVARHSGSRQSSHGRMTHGSCHLTHIDEGILEHSQHHDTVVIAPNHSVRLSAAMAVGLVAVYIIFCEEHCLPTLVGDAVTTVDNSTFILMTLFWHLKMLDASQS